ncbi:MAG: ketoacyl-ACP synthase III [Myxococcales bacterium]|nr:ketoacyl-ACP synthase III [Myxococcales bacterium]
MPEPRYAALLGTGRYLPERVVTNVDLEEILDTSDQWIQERTGIRERRYVADGESGAMMATAAARHALEMAHLRPDDVDLIVLATLSPDVCFPGNGVYIGAELGIPGTPCLDIRQQCTGFIYGLSLAEAYIRSGRYDYVLVIGSEIHSSGIEMAPRGRDVSVLFGDGAGAALLGPTTDVNRALLGTWVHSDGRHAEELWTEGPASRKNPRVAADDVANGSVFPKMNGQKVFKFACRHMVEAVKEAVDAQGVQIADVDFFVFHQANMRIIDFVLKALRIPESKTHCNIDRYGNTTAASIPIALDEAGRAAMIPPGALVCLAAFGSGFTWGSALLRWPTGEGGTQTANEQEGV